MGIFKRRTRGSVRHGHFNRKEVVNIVPWWGQRMTVGPEPLCALPELTGRGRVTPVGHMQADATSGAHSAEHLRS